MDSLIINRVKYKIDSAPTIIFSRTADLMYRKEANFIKSKLPDDSRAQFQDWCDQEGIVDTDKVFFDFYSDEHVGSLILRSSEYFYPKFIKSVLSKYFLERGFLVEEYPRALDLALYEKKATYENDPEWEVFRKYGILIRSQSREITINIESDQTLVSTQPQLTSNENVHVVFGDGRIRRKSKVDISPFRLVASRDVLNQLNFQFRPKPVSYKEIYKELVSFINNYLKPFRHNQLFFQTAGLTKVSESNMFRVSLYNNKMLFGNSNVDINAISGMRDFGPYKASPKALENRFIFIYENRDDANKLYQYFKNGYRHFPGLERYVKIPATLDRDKTLNYSNINSLEKEFDDFIANKLNEDNYENHFAIVIGPFDKVEADEQESHLYYHIKAQLLRKGISSQFIDYRNIRNGSVFHFHLPNIAIAILAKMGGIPWRLENKDYQELVVGFNQVRLGSQSFIGSAVFFSNDGSLGSVNAFPKSTSTRILVDHLKQAINSYLEQNNYQTGLQRVRLVIHYFKPYSSKEARELETLLDELKLDIPYAVVEINDSKTHTDICFDEEYGMGMPESGRYVRIANGEYLIFNNNRYEKRPLRAVAEELPIKAKIHFDYYGEFSHAELINQVYEFSRLYWKSLKQKSQPVTTIYSKLIAEFSAEYEGNLPQSSLASSSPWFL